MESGWLVLQLDIFQPRSLVNWPWLKPTWSVLKSVPRPVNRKDGKIGTWWHPNPILFAFPRKIVELEEELRVVGNNLKSLEVSEEKVLFPRLREMLTKLIVLCRCLKLTGGFFSFLNPNP